MIISENGILNIKNKITEIKKARKGIAYHNYYNNCDKISEIFCVYGVNTVLFWAEDAGVCRGYFYSVDLTELKDMLSYYPDGCVIDYITKTEGELRETLLAGGLTFLYEMHRLSYSKLTDNERQQIAEKQNLLMETLYYPDNCKCATSDDLDELYSKLYEVFDPRESHLPTKEKLLEYIDNKWIAMYREANELKGFQIFTVENGQFYGYQIWNGSGPECYFTLVQTTNRMYIDYLHKVGIDPLVKKVKPSYCWINVKNKKSMRLSLFWGQKFDGLYDYVYQK